MSTPRELLRQCADHTRFAARKTAREDGFRPPEPSNPHAVATEAPEGRALYRTLMRQHDRVRRRETD